MEPNKLSGGQSLQGFHLSSADPQRSPRSSHDHRVGQTTAPVFQEKLTDQELQKLLTKSGEEELAGELDISRKILENRRRSPNDATHIFNASIGLKRTLDPSATDPRNLEALRNYCQAGADVNQRDANGLTPLMIAAKLLVAQLPGAEGVLRTLLDFGANVRAIDDDGMTALDYLEERDSSFSRDDTQIQALKELLLKKINIEDIRIVPLSEIEIIDLYERARTDFRNWKHIHRDETFVTISDRRDRLNVHIHKRDVYEWMHDHILSILQQPEYYNQNDVYINHELTYKNIGHLLFYETHVKLELTKILDFSKEQTEQLNYVIRGLISCGVLKKKEYIKDVLKEIRDLKQFFEDASINPAEKWNVDEFLQVVQAQPQNCASLKKLLNDIGILPPNPFSDKDLE